MPITIEQKNELAKLLFKFSNCENMDEHKAAFAEYSEYRKPLNAAEIDKYFVELNRQRARYNLRSIAMYLDDCWKKCTIIENIKAETFEQFIMLDKDDIVTVCTDMIVARSKAIAEPEDLPPDESEELPPEE